MAIQNVDDLRTPIGDILQLAGSDGILLQAQGQTPFVVMPLDDELLDSLSEIRGSWKTAARSVGAWPMAPAARKRR